MFALRDLRSSAKRHPRRATSSDVDLVSSAALNNADRSAAVWARTAPSPIGASACLSLRETYAQPDKHPTRGSGPLDLIDGAHPDVIDGPGIVPSGATGADIRSASTSCSVGSTETATATADPTSAGGSPRCRRWSLVARGGVEPPTYRFSGGRSYQLSYLANSG